MTDYDPNLPQEFAHMPKRHNHVGAILLVLALVMVFFLSAYLAVPPSDAPATGDVASEEQQPASSAETPAAE